VTASWHRRGSACSSIEAIGSRVAFANAELRYPILRKVGGNGIGLPPIDGLFFYDAGVAWTKGQTVTLTRPSDYDYTKQRALLTSYGFGFRMNLFNLAIIRWDWAKPVSHPGAKGFGTWFFGASY
jgi:outer membrane protein assembly factor BamA